MIDGLQNLSFPESYWLDWVGGLTRTAFIPYPLWVRWGRRGCRLQ